MIEAYPPKWESRLCNPGPDWTKMGDDSSDWGTCALAEYAGIHRRMPPDEFERVDEFIAGRYPALWNLGHAFHELVMSGEYADAERIRIRIVKKARRVFFSGHVLEGPRLQSPWERLPK